MTQHVESALELAVAAYVEAKGPRRAGDLLALVADKLTESADTADGFPTTDEALQVFMDDLIRSVARRAWAREVSVPLYIDRMVTAAVCASAELAGPEKTAGLLRHIAGRIDEGALDLTIQPTRGH